MFLIWCLLLMIAQLRAESLVAVTDLFWSRNWRYLNQYIKFLEQFFYHCAQKWLTYKNTYNVKITYKDKIMILIIRTSLTIYYVTSILCDVCTVGKFEQIIKYTYSIHTHKGRDFPRDKPDCRTEIPVDLRLGPKVWFYIHLDFTTGKYEPFLHRITVYHYKFTKLMKY